MRHSTTARDTVRAISSPVLLILVGALFLVDYSGGYQVRQTWPLLLISMGISKIVEHLVSSPDTRWRT